MTYVHAAAAKNLKTVTEQCTMFIEISVRRWRMSIQ